MDITVFGIPTHISPVTMWLVVMFVLTGVSYIRRIYRDAEPYEYVLGALAAAIAIVVSVFIHEFSHGLVAHYFGIPIVSAGADWWGAFVQPADVPITYGQNALITFAGPFSNAVLGLAATWLVYNMDEGILENSIQYFARVSLELAAINMIPFFGLDGQGVLQGILHGFSLDASRVGFAIIAGTMTTVALAVFVNIDDWLQKL